MGLDKVSIVRMPPLAIHHEWNGLTWKSRVPTAKFPTPLNEEEGPLPLLIA